ncbi:MAG: hypothetical protein HYX24_02595 [Candidatus Aenigmarchaeota archaeon]|nr:hypothetical protein [Candidatus Aenigmarchaeota archaeon]
MKKSKLALPLAILALFAVLVSAAGMIDTTISASASGGSLNTYKGLDLSLVTMKKISFDTDAFQRQMIPSMAISQQANSKLEVMGWAGIVPFHSVTSSHGHELQFTCSQFAAQHLECTGPGKLDVRSWDYSIKRWVVDIWFHVNKATGKADYVAKNHDTGEVLINVTGMDVGKFWYRSG